MSEVTISKTILAEAFAKARIEFGVGTEADFTATRVNAKGKATTRSELGVALSGNKVERAKHVAHIALTMWVTGKLPQLSAEIRRVFPKLEQAVSAQNAAINSLIKTNPELAGKLRLISIDRPAKADIGKMFDLAKDLAGADKGEKAKMCAVGQVINEYEIRARAIALELAALEQAK